MGRTSLGISQRRPSISRLAAVAAELGRMTSAAVTRMGPPAEPQGMALGDCVCGALATPGKRPPSPTQPTDASASTALAGGGQPGIMPAPDGAA